LRDPPYLPMGVRAAPTMTTSREVITVHHIVQRFAVEACGVRAQIVNGNPAGHAPDSWRNSGNPGSRIRRREIRIFAARSWGKNEEIQMNVARVQPGPCGTRDAL
jgi:hypothetical protein